jgi:hypothetical protein
MTATSLPRFQVSSVREAETIAERIYALLAQMSYKGNMDMARATVAFLYGYASWHDVTGSVTETRQAGPYDDDLSPTDRDARWAASIEGLVKTGLTQSAARVVLTKAAPFGPRKFIPTPLEWSVGSEGLWECRGEKSGLRILLGHEVVKNDPFRPDRGQKGLRERMGGAGFSAVSLYVVEGNERESDYIRFSADSVDEIKTIAQVESDERQYEQHQLSLLGREETTNDNLEMTAGSTGRIVQSYTKIADGLFLLEAQGKEYWRVHSSWLDQIPEAFRIPADEDSWADLRVDDIGGMIPMVFPDFFTDREVKLGRSALSYGYSDVIAAFEAGENATKIEKTKAGRGIVNTKIDYTILEEFEGSANDIVVLATPFCVSGFSDGSDNIQNEIHMYRISAKQLDQFHDEGTIRQDEYEYVGVYHQSYPEYRAAKLGEQSTVTIPAGIRPN